MFKKFSKNFNGFILKQYKQRVRQKFNNSLNYFLEVSRQILKKSKYCFVITNGENEWPSARMVQPIIEFDTFVVWLGTNPSLRKVKEIQQNPYVTLAFGKDNENANLIIYGKATIENSVRDRIRHWIGSWLLFFPSGPKGEDFVSIRVEPLEMELMSFKKFVVPEPFGLKPIRLKKVNGEWEVVNMQKQQFL